MIIWSIYLYNLFFSVILINQVFQHIQQSIFGNVLTPKYVMACAIRNMHQTGISEPLCFEFCVGLFPNWRNSMEIATLQMIGQASWITNFELPINFNKEITLMGPRKSAPFLVKSPENLHIRPTTCQCFTQFSKKKGPLCLVSPGKRSKFYGPSGIKLAAAVVPILQTNEYLNVVSAMELLPKLQLFVHLSDR